MYGFWTPPIQAEKQGKNCKKSIKTEYLNPG